MAQKKSAKKVSGRRKPTASGEDLERLNKALETFESGIKSLHKGDIDRARQQFESVVEQAPDEKELRNRALVYLQICDRQAKSSGSFTPRTYGELATYGVFLLNQGDTERAIKYLSRALELQPENDYALYCLAAAHARAGDADAAARYLKQSIAVDPYSRVVALSDGDFDPVRRDSKIADLLSHGETAARS